MTAAKPIWQHMDPAAISHFWSKVDRRGADECWMWTGAPSDRGYGRFYFPGRELGPFRAHRIALAICLGRDIATDMQAAHLCADQAAERGEPNWANRLCVNPRHIAELSGRDNTLASPITIQSVRSAKTHCTRGHSLTGKNLQPSQLRHGRRQCLICHRANDRTRTALLREARLSLGISQREYRARYGSSDAVALDVIANQPAAQLKLFAA